MTNDWIEHNGGPQPVADDVWVEVAGLPMSFQAKRLDWTRSRAYRIINQHLIDAARLEGIRLGLDAAAKVIAGRQEAASKCPDGGSEWLRTDHMIADLRALKPDTIAKEAQHD